MLGCQVFLTMRYQPVLKNATYIVNIWSIKRVYINIKSDALYKYVSTFYW